MKLIFIATINIWLNVFNVINQKIDLYNEALRHYFVKFPPKNSTIYIEYNPSFKTKLIENIDDKKVIYLDNNHPVEFKISYIIYRVVPAFIEDGFLKVNIIEFSVSKERKNLIFTNIGGGSISYKYNCKTDSYELTD